MTGRLETMSRAEAQSAIKSNGGKASSSVSRKTDFLVAGADAGSKHATAVRLGVPVLDEEQFVRALNGEVVELTDAEDSRPAGQMVLEQ